MKKTISQNTPEDELKKLCLRYIEKQFRGYSQDVVKKTRERDERTLFRAVQFYKQYQDALPEITIEEAYNLSQVLDHYFHQVNGVGGKGRRPKSDEQKLLEYLTGGITGITLAKPGKHPLKIRDESIIRAVVDAIKGSTIFIFINTKQKGRPLDPLGTILVFHREELEKLNKLGYEFLWWCFNEVSDSFTPQLETFERRMRTALAKPRKEMLKKPA